MSNRLIFASTACLASRTSLEEVLDRYVAAGLEYIEIGAARPTGTHDLRNSLAGYSAHFLIHNYFIQPAHSFVLNLAAQDARLLEQSLALCRQAIDLCAGLGAPFYSVHAGFRADPTPQSLGQALQYGQVSPYELAHKTFVESLHRLLDYGRERGVQLLVEPNVLARFNLVQGRNDLLLICTGDEIVQMMRNVNDPNLGILLDTGHLNVTAHTLGFEREDFIDQVAPYVRALHVHENDGQVDKHWPVQIDSWVLAVLDRSEFANLPLIVEAKFETVADLRLHIDWLKDRL